LLLRSLQFVVVVFCSVMLHCSGIGLIFWGFPCVI
jgi:hypothetical protein